MHHALGPMLREYAPQRVAIRHIHPFERKSRPVPQPGQSGAFQFDIVIIIQAVYADNRIIPVKQPRGDERTDKSRRASNQHLHLHLIFANEVDT